MKYGIGLDIGITSIGWVTVALDSGEMPYRLDKLGCRIFDIAENAKDGSSLALPRREARSTRRRLRRCRHRIERIKQLILNFGLLTQDELDTLYDSEISDIYQIRSEALDRVVTNDELARILLHIAKRRGFKSNRRSDKKEKENGSLLTAISENEKLMSEKGYRTIGEMFFKDERFSEHKRNKGENYLNTTTRTMVEDEVRKIFEKQKSFGQPFATDDFLTQYLNILLSQRSFDNGPGEPSPYAGSQIEHMIGKCSLEPEEYRAAKAEYHTQYAILLENINHLKIVSQGASRALTKEEREKICKLAFNKPDLSFAAIRKELSLSETEYFNALSYGDKTQAEVEKAKFNYLKAYHAIKKVINGQNKDLWESITEDELDEVGYVLTCYKTEDNTKQFLEEKGIKEELSEIVLDMPNFSGFARLSRKATKNIIPFLEQGMRYDEACKAAGYEFRVHGTGLKQKYLPANSEELNDITNPVVRRAVSQTIKVVNAIIRYYGESPLFVNVELAREMAKDHNERQKLKNENDKNHERNGAIIRKLKEEFHLADPKGEDIVKFKLWEEQGCKCAYSLEPLKAERLFEPGYVDIDHIIPYSDCFNDSYHNKILVKSSENRQKGDRVPLQYLSGEQKDRFIIWVNETIKDYKKKQNLLKERVTEEDRNKFIDRNLNDTKYIARFIRNYFEDYLAFAESDKGTKKRIHSVNGAVTGYLRKRWGINKIREDGDAHHIVDAAVIACTTDGMIKRITDYSHRREIEYMKDESSGNDVVVDRRTGEVLKGFPEPWPNFRKELLIRSETNNPAEILKEEKFVNYTGTELEKVEPVFVSRMPKHKNTGPAHKETIKSPKALAEGYTISKRPLSALKLDSNGEITDYYKPESDTLLYEALKKRLLEYGGDGKKAFGEGTPDFHKPKADGTNGPIVKKVKFLEKSTMNVPVLNGKGVADNDSMIRIDVFYIEGEGYYWVPIYVADTLKRELPNKAVVASKPYNQWKDMKDEDFIFSLYPNDLIRVKNKRKMSLKIIQKDSTLAPIKEDNDCFLYFVSGGINTASLTVITHDKTYTIASLGVKTLQKLEKYQVDVLGNITKVNKEKRMGFRK